MKILSAELVASAADPGQLPASGLPELALLGRSNVGKSSLLNRLVGRRKLAFTSATPGKTRLIHCYRVVRPGRELLLVDLPGYGWARVSKAERGRWKALVEGYLEKRAALGAALLLQDLRRDVSEDETLLLDWLSERDVPALVVLTKTDKLKAMRRAARIEALSKQLDPASVLPTSARTGEGIDPLWRAIDRLLFG